MEIKDIASEIEKKIRELEAGRKIIGQRAEAKAIAIAEYDKVLAIEILKLRMDGTPISIIEKIAKGNCWEARLELEKAEGMYKAATSGMSSLETEVCAWQSIFRHLDNL